MSWIKYIFYWESRFFSITFFPFLYLKILLAKICWNLLTLISSIISAELDKLLEDAPLPFIMQHAAKISGVRKRVSSLNSLLKSIQRRVDNIDGMLSMGLAHGIYHSLHICCSGFCLMLWYLLSFYWLSASSWMIYI